MDMPKYSELPVTERPAYKLKINGAKALPNAELIALAAGIDDIEKVHRLFAGTSAGLKDIAYLTQNSLTDAGLTPKEAAKLRMAFEVGKRLHELTRAEKMVSEPPDIYHEASEICHLPQEHIMVISVNLKNEIIHKDIVSIGTACGAIAEPGDILRPAIACGAAGICIVHNHPSGDTAPSCDDMRVTGRIYEAAEICGIRLLDHVVVGTGDPPYASIKKLAGYDFGRLANEITVLRIEARMAAERKVAEAAGQPHKGQ
jgi:DNA repair protein RadC